MKKFTTLLCSALVISLVNGCASAPEASAQGQLLAKGSVPPPGKATVYLIRPGGSMMSGATAEVVIDNVLVGRLGLKSYLCLFVEPGPHEIKTVVCLGFGGKEPPVRQNFNFEVGGIQYLKGSFIPHGYTFKQIPELEGMKFTSTFRLTDSEGAEGGKQ